MGAPGQFGRDVSGWRGKSGLQGSELELRFDRIEESWRTNRVEGLCKRFDGCEMWIGQGHDESENRGPVAVVGG